MWRGCRRLRHLIEDGATVREAPTHHPSPTTTLNAFSTQDTYCMLTEQKGDSHVQTADSLGFCSILLSATMLNTIWGKHFFFFWAEQNDAT